MTRSTVLSCAFFLCLAASARGLEYPGTAPGEVIAAIKPGCLFFANDALEAVWQTPGNEGGFRLLRIVDRPSNTTLEPAASEAFTIVLKGRSLPASAFRLEREPRMETIEATAGLCQAVHFFGRRITLDLVEPKSGLRVTWQATLRDESNYIGIELAVRAPSETPIESITVLELAAPGAAVQGAVEGSPIVCGNLFFACEHPLAANRVENGKVVCSVRVPGPLRPGQTLARTAVIGVAPAGQMRRAFAYYIERERPRPYRPFLHYNSWYDIAWGDRKMDEAGCLAVIEQLGQELVEKRGVVVDSFVFDDGWDDNRTLWGFHPGFPRGFAPLTAAAKKYRGGVGAWLSPWGGYGQAQKERLEYGVKEGFETNRNGFSMAGPKYYARFRDACAAMVERFDVNYFKFDGIAQGISSSGAGSEFAADVEGLLRLCTDLRRLRPNVYISITTGTWPSPYWLFYGDSIWRNGGDMGFQGAGSPRQRWITYRDTIEHQWIVRRAPLYPLNSLMTQGIAQARLGDASKLGGDLEEWKSEVRSFFASGTQLQELYITPSLLTPAMYDVLAAGAKWSRENADVLADVHWIGGDPGKGEVYGFAAWQPRQAMLMLRNPSEKAASIEIDPQQAFELPPSAARRYRLVSPWSDGNGKPIELTAGQSRRFELRPFEVLVLDALPIAAGRGESAFHAPVVFASAEAPSEKPARSAGGYAIVVSAATRGDAGWNRVVETLCKRRRGEVIVHDKSVEESLPDLKRLRPEHVCFICTPAEAGREFVAQVSRMMRRLDDDPYTDALWGIVTGRDAAAALRMIEPAEPLVVRRAAAGTEIDLSACDEGVWFCELNAGKMVRKRPGKEPAVERVPTDTTKAIVDVLNQERPDLFVTSGHATERDWQIGYRYRNGQFRCEGGRLFGLDTQGRRHPIDSPNPKVYLPVGNCLMGHIDGPEAMALAFFNSAGVRQMAGYTVPSWYGYAGWGMLDYFVEQPGRFTLAEAFFANQQALVHRLATYFPGTETAERFQPSGKLPPAAASQGLTWNDARGLLYDRDTLAFYGDPAFEARMAPAACHWEQTLTEKDGRFTLEIRPLAGEKSFEPRNQNGSQRGGRPIFQRLSRRIDPKTVRIVAGQDLHPLIADDFILVPLPKKCEPGRVYRVVLEK